MAARSNPNYCPMIIITYHWLMTVFRFTWNLPIDFSSIFNQFQSWNILLQNK